MIDWVGEMEVRAGNTMDVDKQNEFSVNKQEDVIPSLKLHGQEVLDV